jgi:deazaflavin-dependent oxidoreductase (nitroreductase family)
VGIPPVDPSAPKGVAARTLEPLFLGSFGKWFLMNVSRRVDPTLLRASRGRVSTVMITPVVLLTARGAKSGLERTVPLLYFTDGDRVILMASNYGGTKHPAWFHNVRANPAVTLSAGGSTGPFVASIAEGEERERLWGLAQSLTRAYTKYEGTTGGREIPIVVFTPA